MFWQRQLECLAVLYDAFGRCMLYARTAALGTAVRGLGEDNWILCPNTLIVATINLTYVNSDTVCPHSAKKINLNLYMSFFTRRKDQSQYTGQRNARRTTKNITTVL